MEPKYLIVVGGDPAAPVRLPPPGELGDVTVVAADSGLDHCIDAGMSVQHVVGDLDSVSPAALAAAEAAGAHVHRHPADKDATDIELAIDLVVDLAGGEAGVLLVVGPGGGRLDHQLADVIVLARPVLLGWAVAARFGTADVRIAVPGRPVALDGPASTQVSLLPIGGLARGVTTAGLRWALADADLALGTTRAMSNELLGGPALVRAGEGVVAVVVPGTVAARIEPRSTPYDPTPRVDPRPDPRRER
jgi:thiamine pyrophosphokinase